MHTNCLRHCQFYKQWLTFPFPIVLHLFNSPLHNDDARDKWRFGLVESMCGSTWKWENRLSLLFSLLKSTINRNSLANVIHKLKWPSWRIWINNNFVSSYMSTMFTKTFLKIVFPWVNSTSSPNFEPLCAVFLSRTGPPDYIIVWWRFP